MEISKVDAAINSAVAKIASTDAAISQIRDEYMSLRVASPQDKSGYKSAEVALKRVARLRISVEKTRKALKADALRYGKAVDAEARRIREAIEPIEEHLKAQCDVVRLEEARQKVAAENARRDEIASWVAELSQLGWPVDLPALQRMTAEEFGYLRLSARKQHAEREAERLELEELRAERAKREPPVDKSFPQVTDVANELREFAAHIAGQAAYIPYAVQDMEDKITAILNRAADQILELSE